MKLVKILSHPYQKIFNEIFISLIIISGLHCKVIAQEKDVSKYGKISLYGDVGTVLAIGSASLNVENSIFRSNSLQLNSRVGFGGAVILFGPEGLGGFGGITALYGKRKHHLESSGGVFIGVTKKIGYFPSGELFALPFLDLGYRYQKPEGGFIVRVKVGILGAGIGLGYALKKTKKQPTKSIRNADFR